MKNLFTAVVLLFLSFGSLSAQSDTLHIYYQGLGTKILDSNETKIGKWAKSLNGKKVDVQVLAYYSDKEFKRYSQERTDELFLILNRKARELINITSAGPVKGQKSQRSKVDIVYSVPGQQPTAVIPVAKPETAKNSGEKEPEKKEPVKKEETAKKEPAKKEKAAEPSKSESKTLPAKSTVAQPVSTSVESGAEEVNSDPTITVSDSEPLKVMVNGEWVEYQNGKKVKKKKK